MNRQLLTLHTNQIVTHNDTVNDTAVPGPNKDPQLQQREHRMTNNIVVYHNCKFCISILTFILSFHFIRVLSAVQQSQLQMNCIVIVFYE